MKKLLLLVAILVYSERQVYATHVRAGEFYYTYIGHNTFRVHIRTFTEICNGSLAADQDRLPFTWGDEQPGAVADTIFRTQIIAVGDSTPGMGCSYCIRENIYEGNHTYAGFGIFRMGLQDVNRVAGIDNIHFGSSDQIPLYVEDSLYFLDPAQFGPVDNSPILSSNGVDFARDLSTFQHFPNAYDPDGDSLSFEFYEPLRGPGTIVDNYVFPNKVPGANANSTFTIDPLLGTITWNAPYYTGAANIGIKIHEYRKRYNGAKPEYFLIGMIERDLQIIICDPIDHTPIITVHDTCVLAGTHLVMSIGARDRDFGPITIDASGGPFEVNKSPAVYPLPETIIRDSTHAIFDWQTICDHSDNNEYVVVVKATDNYNPSSPVIAYASFKIKVVAPPPKLLTAVPHGNSIVVDWNNPYTCDSPNASRFEGFSVWRREGPNPFKIDSCTPGLDGDGYVEITSGIRAYTYTDKNVVIGKDYCYRILGEFGYTTSLGYVVQFVRSLPSNEICTQLKKDVPIITEASVNTTDSLKGSVAVAWSNPIDTILDTIQHPGPYRYEVFHSNDFNAASPTLIHTFISNTFVGLMLDSTFTDSVALDINHPRVDTKDSVHSYFIKFFSDTSFLGQTQNASTIFLSITSAGRILNLSWNENVPWTNDTFFVYRKNHVTQNFDFIASTLAQSYTDVGLKNDTTYCYRIKSKGHYSATGLPYPIINYSQIDCAIPIDTVGPCAPVLTVNNQCTDPNYSQGAFTNFLTWTKPAFTCGHDAVKYFLYYSPDASTALALIDSSHLLNDTTFLHQLNNTVAGCYAILAVDSSHNKGPLSAKICVDNCPEYNLPNTFTPNGDASNDKFVPRNPYRFIDKVSMKIYTSWGTLVFQTSDPAINWDGKVASTGKDAPDGTYYYICDVYEDTFAPANKPTKTLSGFIHLYR